MTSQNERAQQFRSLHKPGQPIILTNVYDVATAELVASHPRTKAMSTASYAVAAVTGIRDEDLTLDENLAAVRRIAAYMKRKHPEMPLAVDLQDGYTDIEASMRAILAEGIIGCNIEDVDSTTQQLRTADEAVQRIKTAVQTAAANNVPAFAVNARTDVLGFGGSIDDAIARGRQYLAAGACTVFVWGGAGGRGVSKDEVSALVKGLDGMLNVKMNLRPGFLNAAELAELGVARISVGPELFHKAMAGYRSAVNDIYAAGTS